MRRESKNVTNDGYTDSSWDNLQNVIEKAEDLVESNPVQGENGVGTKNVEDAKEEILEAIKNLQKKADYTAFNEAFANAEDILNDTVIVYTESSKKAVAEAYNKANELNKDLPVSEQTMVDEVTTELSVAVLGIKIKADYTEFDKAVEKAKEELQKDVVYTSSTKQALENVLNNAENVNRDLSVDEQIDIDSVKDSVKKATEELTEAADISAFKDVIEEAEKIIAEGNEKGNYDDEDWNEFIDSVTQAKEGISSKYDDIPKTEQEKIDEFTNKLNSNLTNIKNNRYVIIEFMSDKNVLYKGYRIKVTEEITFNDLEDVPLIPETTAFKKYIGWNYADGTQMQLTDVVDDNVTVYCIEEELKLVAKEESEALIDTDKGFFKGLRDGNTVESLIASLDNDADYFVVKDRAGNVVDGNTLITTGMTIELVSKTEQSKKNDVITIVVKADVNGDGLVNDEDVQKTLDACCQRIKYTEDEKAYFEATDTNGDGVLDVLDAFNVSNMRFGNY